MSSTRSYWDDVYRRKSANQVSWYRSHLDRSISWIEALAGPADAVLDVGGGASTLVDDLLLRGFQDVSVLDVSPAALEAAQKRLDVRAPQVSWIAADITDWHPPRRYRVWHDRAVFHFMTTPPRRDAYLAALREGTGPGSLVIISTFAPDGPEMCSGLPVQRYCADALAAKLGSDFGLVEQARQTHRTPWGGDQAFTCAAFRRLGDVG